jgi:outer membrane protein insertion porin family
LLSAGWARDTRDSVVYPRQGTYQRAYGEMAVPPADLRYTKLKYQYQHWLPFGRDYARMLNADLGWAKGYSGKTLPFYKNFYAGGIGSVRGFEQSSIGPKDDVTDDSLGGNRRFVGNAEFYFPLPGTGMDRSFRLSAFMDMGTVWGESDKANFGDLRYSAGLAFSWSSPIGPLKFSLGIPLKKQDDDELQKFQFQLGSVF